MSSTVSDMSSMEPSKNTKKSSNRLVSVSSVVGGDVSIIMASVIGIVTDFVTIEADIFI